MTNRFKENAPQAFSSSHVVIPDGTADHRVFIRHALEGCRDLFREGYGYKKAGVVITRLVQEEGYAHSLFSDMDALEKESRLSTSIDSINKLFGRGAVLLGSQGNGEIKMSREHQSPHYTTLWSDIPKAKVR
jgi:DNA polymerase V